ncbi:MAG: 5-formyltetrahydrofolate cyclo-ligase [Oscillospiraceae bacterium]|nr:5-formyltetrahydrofolate cyclo-ligase [Oscillospiraceae bacterium]
MNKALADEKKALRRQILQQRAAMSFELRAAADAAITAAVLRHPFYQAAKQVFCYVSMPHEVSTRTLLAEILSSGRTLGLPVCDPLRNEMTFYRLDSLKELTQGAYRIPVPPASEDRILLPDADTLMILPMLSFDNAGRRLGAGGGYYDRYLANNQIKTLGICYADCKLAQLPHDAHDQRLMCCVTEQKTEDFYG